MSNFRTLQAVVIDGMFITTKGFVDSGALFTFLCGCPAASTGCFCCWARECNFDVFDSWGTLIVYTVYKIIPCRKHSLELLLGGCLTQDKSHVMQRNALLVINMIFAVCMSRRLAASRHLLFVPETPMHSSEEDPLLRTCCIFFVLVCGLPVSLRTIQN